MPRPNAGSRTKSIDTLLAEGPERVALLRQLNDPFAWKPHTDVKPPTQSGGDSSAKHYRLERERFGEEEWRIRAHAALQQSGPRAPAALPPQPRPPPPLLPPPQRARWRRAERQHLRDPRPRPSPWRGRFLTWAPATRTCPTSGRGRTEWSGELCLSPPVCQTAASRRRTERAS